MKTKATQTYTSMKNDEEENDFDIEIKELKASGTKVAKVTKEKPFRSKGASKRQKTETYVEKPTLFVDDIIKLVTVDGNLRPMTEFFDDYGDADKRVLEEATIKYLNIYNKALIEITFEIPKSLADILELRKENAKSKDIKIREHVLINLCPQITPDQMNMIFKEVKDDFRRKKRMNKLMLGEIDEIVKDTQEILLNALKTHNLPIVEEEIDDGIESSIPDVEELKINEQQTELDDSSILEKEATNKEDEKMGKCKKLCPLKVEVLELEKNPKLG